MEASKEPTETKEAKENDIAARREARRKKILENSSGRLGRITGRDHSDENRQNGKMQFKSINLLTCLT